MRKKSVICSKPDRLYKYSLALLSAVIVSTFPAIVEASSIITDTISVSTISGQSQSNGITFSSSVYFVSGSSLTLQGATGYVTSASSVTASSFFGDASHISLTGPVTLIDTQTFSGANTFTSAFTIQSGGKQIIFSTDSINNILSISGTGTITFSPSLHNSSSTLVPLATTTNTNFGPCVSGSTLTITTTGGRVEALMSGFLNNSTIGATAALNLLQDGNFVNDLTSTKAIVRSQSPTGNNGALDVGPFRYLLNAPNAGTHSYCLTIAAPNGGGTTQLGETSFSSIVFFYVNEIK